MPIGTSAEQTAWLCLDGVPGIGPVRALRLLAKASPQQLCQMDSCQLEHLGLSSAQIDSLKHPEPQRMEQVIRWCDEPGHHLVCYGDECYPTWLRAIPAAPLVLFVEGDVSLLSAPQIAMVGTRNPTSSGRSVAAMLTQELVAEGLVITSGMALGIDAVCHQTALQTQGRTLAVLGSGLRHCYPRRHLELSRQIVGQGGALVSELWPDVADKDLIEERILLFKNRFKKLVRLSIDYSATMSVGAVLIEEKKNKLSYGELFYMADSILYTVKSNGKGRHAIMTKGEFEQSSYRHKWMLIADGEETQRKILTNAFRDEYELIYAIDGEEAKKWITYYSDRLDVVIIDLNLPTISGQEIIRWMGSQEELGNVAIIATNNIQAKKANENDVGAPLFFKPFDLMYLKNKIDRLIVALSEKESIEWNQNM